jgi:OmpA-OmpF porin, OOP family
MRTRFRVSVIVAVLASLGAPSGALAQSEAYGTDTSGRVVKSGFGHCVRTSQWTPSKATGECDPDLASKPAPRRVEVAPEPMTVIAPAPIAAPAVAIEPPKVAALRVPKVQTVTLGADTSFDVGKAELKPEGKARLDELATKLQGVRIESLVVVGHTDNVGGDTVNQKLSLRRAEAVKTYLIGKGVEATKVRTVGRGKSSPVADNKTAQGRAKNRRVEVDLRGARTVL